MGKTLNNKPLAEAIFELRWGIQGMPGQFTDQNHQILLGKLYDYFQRDGYTFHEPLAAAEMPPIMSGHNVQHRFRVDKDKWPLVQVGQGILTVNDVENYNWDEDFYDRCIRAISGLYENYPGDFSDMPKQSISLKYIDAYDFNYKDDDITSFLKERMSLDLRLPDKLISSAGASGNPKVFASSFIYEIPKPKGEIRFRVANGARGSTQNEVLIWETEVRSTEVDILRNIDDFSAWLTDAHTVTSDWFFGLIEGELEKEFE